MPWLPVLVENSGARMQLRPPHPCAIHMDGSWMDRIRYSVPESSRIVDFSDTDRRRAQPPPMPATHASLLFYRSNLSKIFRFSTKLLSLYLRSPVLHKARFS